MVIPFTNNGNKDISTCSFCDVSENDTTVLIAGAEAAICENCIVNANGTLLNDVGVFDALSNQQFDLQKKINKSFALITILFVLAFTIIIATTIFRH